MRGGGAVIPRTNINSTIWERAFANAAIRAIPGRLVPLGKRSPCVVLGAVGRVRVNPPPRRGTTGTRVMVCIARVHIFEIYKGKGEEIMPWLRMGDTLVTHPLMIRLLEVCKGNHQLKNEAVGVLAQLAIISAAHLTDYWVGYGSLYQIAPGREEAMLEMLCGAGLLFQEEGPEGYPALRLVDDRELFHMRSKEEVELDRLRSKDKHNIDLLVKVRIRDGDQCRWCGCWVDWRDRRSGRSGTYDSLNGHKNSTPETLVVACRSCNSARGAGEVKELRDPPTPEEVHYNKHTIAFINDSRYAKEHDIYVVSKDEREKQARWRQEQEQASQRSRRAKRQSPAQSKAVWVDEPKATMCHDTASQATSVAAGPVQGFDDPLEAAPDWVSGEEPPAGWVPSGMMDFADDSEDCNDMDSSPTAAEAAAMGEKNPPGPPTPTEGQKRNSNVQGMPRGNHNSKSRRRGRRRRKRGKRKQE